MCSIQIIASDRCLQLAVHVRGIAFEKKRLQTLYKISIVPFSTVKF